MRLLLVFSLFVATFVGVSAQASWGWDGVFPAAYRISDNTAAVYDWGRQYGSLLFNAYYNNVIPSTNFSAGAGYNDGGLTNAQASQIHQNSGRAMHVTSPTTTPQDVDKGTSETTYNPALSRDPTTNNLVLAIAQLPSSNVWNANGLTAYYSTSYTAPNYVPGTITGQATTRPFHHAVHCDLPTSTSNGCFLVSTKASNCPGSSCTGVLEVLHSTNGGVSWSFVTDLSHSGDYGYYNVSVVFNKGYLTVVASRTTSSSDYTSFPPVVTPTLSSRVFQLAFTGGVYAGTYTSQALASGVAVGNQGTIDASFQNTIPTTTNDIVIVYGTPSATTTSLAYVLCAGGPPCSSWLGPYAIAVSNLGTNYRPAFAPHTGAAVIPQAFFEWNTYNLNVVWLGTTSTGAPTLYYSACTSFSSTPSTACTTSSQWTTPSALGDSGSGISLAMPECMLDYNSRIPGCGYLTNKNAQGTAAAQLYYARLGADL